MFTPVYPWSFIDHVPEACVNAQHFCELWANAGQIHSVKKYCWQGIGMFNPYIKKKGLNGACHLNLKWLAECTDNHIRFSGVSGRVSGFSDGGLSPRKSLSLHLSIHFKGRSLSRDFQTFLSLVRSSSSFGTCKMHQSQPRHSLCSLFWCLYLAR